MSDWPLSFTALRIAKLFIESTARKYCCIDISRELALPNQTSWNSLRSLTSEKILEPEKEWVSPLIEQRRQPKVFYRITDHGLRVVTGVLSDLQLSTLRPSA